MTESEAFLLDQVPMALRPSIPTTLKTAYEAAQLIIDGEPILNVPSAQDNRGRIIQWATDFGFQKLVQTGSWSGFDMRWRPFAKPTGRYLEIIASHSVLTISQCADPAKQPRDVAFRTNKRLNNQGRLAGIIRDEGPSTIGLPHILLVHGYQELNFAHLGLPSEKHHEGYLYRTPNLMLMPHEVPMPEAAMEDTDIEAVMTLKEEIDRWRKDND